MIAVTGANGNLGLLVVKGLLERVPADDLVALIRNPEKGHALHSLGVGVRVADYDRPETLEPALQGVEKLLLISGSLPGDRLRQHGAVIEAARKAGVRLLIYTSVLRADTSELELAKEHKETEECLKTSGLEVVLLRNGWWFENHTDNLAGVLANNAIVGASGVGRFAAATREDYAAAAVATLTQPGHEGKTYELAGDETYSAPELAQELSKQLGRPITCTSLPADTYEGMLLSFGLPKVMVDTIVDAETKSVQGVFESSSRDLSKLIGRPTTSLAEAVKAAIGA